MCTGVCMRKIAIINQKGGVGKTTTAINISACLSNLGLRVLLIDMDSQGNVANCFKVKCKKGTSELLTGADLNSILLSIKPKLDLVLSDHRLAATELILSAKENRELILTKSLSLLEDKYDFILLDCPPTQNSLIFADELVIPLTLDDLSLIGASKILKMLIYLKEEFNHEIKYFSLVPTMYDKRTRVSRDCLDLLYKSFPNKIAPAIRLNTKFKESNNHGKSIIDYEKILYQNKEIKEKKGSLDYFLLAKFILSNNKLDNIDSVRSEIYQYLHRRVDTPKINNLKKEKISNSVPTIKSENVNGDI